MRSMTTLRGKDAWTLRGYDLIHGTISGQDIANGELTIHTDDGAFLTLPCAAVAFDVTQVRQRIAAAVQQLARTAARFDREHTWVLVWHHLEVEFSVCLERDDALAGRERRAQCATQRCFPGALKTDQHNDRWRCTL